MVATKVSMELIKSESERDSIYTYYKYFVIDTSVEHGDLVKILSKDTVFSHGVKEKEIKITHPAGFQPYCTRVKIPMWMSEYAGFGRILCEISENEVS